MSFPRYPATKDSGVAWLGEVPAHWEVRPIKALAMLKGGAGFPDAEQGTENEELYFYKVAALGQADTKGILQPPPDSISRDTARRLGAFVFPAGSLTFAKVGAALLLARIRQLPVPSCLDNNMMGMLVHQENDTRFVLFAMSLVRFDLIANPGAVPSLNASQIGNFQLALPPRAEQTAIATFLDRETAKIDALVAEQDKLIALLQEKRQAVISHAVTKGLDPNVPMKDSGVEWLGEVPGHWDVKRVKHVKAHEPNSFVDGPFGSNLKSEHYVEDGDVYVIESSFATQGVLDTSNLKTISREHFKSIDRSEARAGDIIIAKIGAQFGKCSILPTLDKPAVVSGNSLKLSVTPDVMDVGLMCWQLVNLKQVGAIDLIVNLTAQPALSLSSMNELPILVPPATEQTQIVRTLALKLEQYDTLTTEARTAITLLQERRTALISAAVTGQIDVRGLAGGQGDRI